MAEKEPAAIIKAHGKALWCKVVEPDYKFDEDGVFSTKLVINEEEKDRLESILQPMLEAHYNEVVKAAKNPAQAKKVVKMASNFKEAVDENGDPTGDYEISFKRKAKIVAKKTGKVYPQKVSVFIGKGKPLPTGVQVGNGSAITVAFEVAKSSEMNTPGYFMQSTKEVGLSLRLQAVLVRELKEYSGNNDASLFDEDEYGEDVDTSGMGSTVNGDSVPNDSDDIDF